MRYLLFLLAGAFLAALQQLLLLAVGFIDVTHGVPTRNPLEDDAPTVPLPGHETLEDIIRDYDVLHINGSAPLDAGIPWTCAPNNGSRCVPQGRSPNVIFQTVKNYSQILPSVSTLMSSWSKINPRWHRIVLDDVAASRLILENFGANAAQSYNSLSIGAMRADFLRLILLHLFGGVYADADTTCNTPIETWYQKSPRRPTLQKDCALAAGVEDDRRGYLMQWALGPAYPRSPGMRRAVDHVLGIISRPIDYSNWEFVHEATGPKAFTEGLFQYVANVSIHSERGEWDNMEGLAETYRIGMLKKLNPRLWKAISDKKLCIMTIAESDRALNNKGASISGLGKDFERQDGGWSSWVRHRCMLYANATAASKRHPSYFQDCKDFF